MKTIVCLLACAVVTTACVTDKRPGQEKPAVADEAAREPAAVPMPGSDRDAHGCIGSAGYSWCGKTNRCERPWELAKQQGFENTAEAYKTFCDTPPPSS